MFEENFENFYSYKDGHVLILFYIINDFVFEYISRTLVLKLLTMNKGKNDDDEETKT